MRNLLALLGERGSVAEREDRLVGMCRALRGSPAGEQRVFHGHAGIAYQGGDGRDRGRGGVFEDRGTGILVGWEGIPTFDSPGETPEQDPGQRMLSDYRDRGVRMFTGWAGIFSAVLWDPREQRVLAAHDPFSHRPLFIADLGDAVAVSTRFRALMALPETPRDIDPEGIYQFLYFSYGAAPRTPLRSVHRLPAAQVAVWERRRLSFERYWDLRYTEDCEDGEERATSEARRLLSNSVDSCLEGSERPGVFLSGGVDSGAIAGFAARRHPDLTTICFGFGEESRSEYEASRAVATRLGTQHVEAGFDGEMLFEHAAELAWSLDVPNAGVVLPFFGAREASRLGVDVALNGMSADLSFGSGHVEWKMKRLDDVFGPLGLLPGGLRNSLLRGMRAGALRLAGDGAEVSRPRKALRLLGGYVDICTGELNFACRTREQDVATLFGSQHDPGRWAHPHSLVRQYLDRARGTNAANRMAYAALGLLSSDGTVPSIPAVSEPADLEVRFPYLDAPLLSYIASMPTEMRFLHGTPKYILRHIAGEMIPEVVAQRPARAFRMPMDRWLLGPLSSLVDVTLAPEAIESRGLFEVDRVRSFLEAWRSSGGSLTPWHLVWGLTILEIWFRVHVDRMPQATAPSTEEIVGVGLSGGRAGPGRAE